MEFLKGTNYFPNKRAWKNSIFFFETSEEKPDQAYIERWLRNYGVLGIFDLISGIIVGRPVGFKKNKGVSLENAIKKVIVGEFGKTKLPIVINTDFGHTDPILTIPMGANATLNPTDKSLTINESGVK